MAVKKMLGRVAYKANLAGTTWLVRINLAEVADFVSGQFVSIKVNKEGMRRSYSVASLPGEKMIDLVLYIYAQYTNLSTDEMNSTIEEVKNNSFISCSYARFEYYLILYMDDLTTQIP